MHVPEPKAQGCVAHTSSAAILEADSASEEDGSGLAADGQEEGKGKDKGKGNTKLRPVGPSSVF